MSFKFLVLKKLEQIMSLIDDLKAAQATSDAKITELQDAVEVSNGKADQLILTANATKDALVALQGSIGNGVTVTAADLQGVIDGINAGTAKAQAAVDSLAAQNVETDAAAAADAP